MIIALLLRLTLKEYLSVTLFRASSWTVGSDT